ncbi:SDR family oxidoreductase [Muriicola sp.]|uniref:SDR family oxidoreductase n=1 Tax=Muriicola sp. TaxID=2020856 RepID=UPI003C70849A
MKLENNTVLITGGSSGIGLELSKVLIQKGNKVIICGRSNEKLTKAREIEPKLITYQCDLSISEECINFSKKITEKHPELNVLINNAAIVNKTNFLNTDTIVEMAENEMQTNFMAPIRLIHLLSPILQKNNKPTIINITTGLIYTPRADYPFYNATKAALHSFTQVFRKQTENSNINIVEVMFPAVKTPWHKGKPPKIAISAEKAVNEMIKGLEKNKKEIRVAGAKMLYIVSRIAPKFAFRKVNSLEDEE